MIVMTRCRDKFDADECGTMVFPCCVCKHGKNRDTDEPCRTCDHNVNAVKDTANKEGEKPCLTA